MFQIIGPVRQPTALAPFGTVQSGAVGILIEIIVNILIVGALVYSLFNFILAGYAFMSAGDDPKKVAGAWAKIWQTMIGLIFVAGAFVLAGIFGWLLFRDFTALLRPVIPTI